jgi:hypothetical protein
MSKSVLIKVTVVIYEDGGIMISCDGNDVDCKVATYAIQVALSLINKLAIILFESIKKTMLEEINKSDREPDRVNTGIM